MTGNADDWRLFLAVPLPEAVKTRILEIESVPAISALPLRFVDPDRAHITLHFLGATPPERAELIALSLQQAFSRQRGAHLSTGELGLYPGARKPRVLWLGIDGDTAGLGVLHRKAGEALLQMGMDIERRAFQAHITIGRVRNEPLGDLADRFGSALQSPQVLSIMRQGPVSFSAGEVHLMRSHLGKHGPRYESIRVYPLANPG